MSTISQNDWSDYFGFRYYPFESMSAAKKIEDPEMWILPPGFARVLGKAYEPQSLLIFAPRGGGKTACRRLIQYYCSPGLGGRDTDEAGGKVLAIPHDNFGTAVRHIQSGQAVGASWHIGQVLRQAMKTLIEYADESPAASEQLKDSVEGLRPACRQELNVLVKTYRPIWSSEIEDLEKLFPGFLNTQPLHHQPELEKIDHLERFTALVCGSGDRGLGFDALYVLVDSLDQDSITANLSQDTIIDIILPLLANRRLMYGIPTLAIKCFLPEEMKTRVLNAPPITNMGVPRTEIDWYEQNVGAMLQRRLRSYKKTKEDSSLTRIEELCVPELRGLDIRLFDVAKGNPRSIIRLCDLMVQAHLKVPILEEPPYTERTFLLNQRDWNQAISKFEAETERRENGDRKDRARVERSVIIQGHGNVVGDGSQSDVHQRTLPRDTKTEDNGQNHPVNQSILMVMANPTTGKRIYLQREKRIIENCLRESKSAGRVALQHLSAASPHDLRQFLLKNDITILHFSVHGNYDKMIFEKEDGSCFEVSLPFLVNEYLARYESIRCIVLNACHTQSDLIRIKSQRHIVAVNGEISSKAAIEFSRGFYDTIDAGREGRDFVFAFQEGRDTMKMAGYTKESQQMVFL